MTDNQFRDCLLEMRDIGRKEGTPDIFHLADRALGNLTGAMLEDGTQVDELFPKECAKFLIKILEECRKTYDERLRRQSS